MGSLEQGIFRRGSTTFFWSSLLFPKNVRKDVFDLYSFVRVADDYVDELPQRPKSLYELRSMWKVGIADANFDTAKHSSDSLNLRVVKNMVRLTRAHNFDPKWVDDFLNSMELDLSWKAPTVSTQAQAKHLTATKAQFPSLKNHRILLFYIHGSAEVVGLMLARIMNLPRHADKYAQMQGRALQTINFIRDLQEDNQLGRCYFVSSDFTHFGLPDLSQETALAKPEAFTAFMHRQIAEYRKYQTEATKGFRYIPRRYRIPIQTAVALYDWSVKQIERNPFIVFDKKVKPSKLRILKTALQELFITNIP